MKLVADYSTREVQFSCEVMLVAVKKCKTNAADQMQYSVQGNQPDTDKLNTLYFTSIYNTHTPHI